MKKEHPLRGSILLFIAALIWGTTFVAQSVGTEYIGTFTFNCLRSIIACIVLFPLYLFQNRLQQKEFEIQNLENEQIKQIKKTERKTLLFGGITCGTALCIASNFQQLGITYSTVGKSAFITALYIVIVPLLGLFFHKKVNSQIWFGVVLASFGLYLLCMKDEGFTLSKGDIFLLLCAFFFSLQILSISYFSPKVNGIKLSVFQFFVTAILSGIPMFLFEQPSMEQIMAAAFPIFYAGAFSSGIAYTLQILGQQDLNPAIASLIMSLESVIATLSGWLFLHESLSTKEMIGCTLVFLAVIFSQIPLSEKKFKKVVDN